MVQKALKELGVTQDEAIYVGDSDVDIATAKTQVWSAYLSHGDFVM